MLVLFSLERVGLYLCLISHLAQLFLVFSLAIALFKEFQHRDPSITFKCNVGFGEKATSMALRGFLYQPIDLLFAQEHLILLLVLIARQLTDVMF